MVISLLAPPPWHKNENRNGDGLVVANTHIFSQNDIIAFQSFQPTNSDVVDFFVIGGCKICALKLICEDVLLIVPTSTKHGVFLGIMQGLWTWLKAVIILLEFFET